MEIMGENWGLGGGVMLMLSCEVLGGCLIGNFGWWVVDFSIFFFFVDYLRVYNNYFWIIYVERWFKWLFLIIFENKI